MLACLGVLGVGFPSAAAAAPHARITSGPPAETEATEAAFEFEASESVLLGSFECRLDGAAWERCVSPKSYSGLLGGPHVFEVRLVGLFADQQPDRWSWTVVQRDEVLPPPPPPPDPGTTPPPPPRPRPPRDARRRDADGCAYGANRAGQVRNALLERAVRCLINRERASHGLRLVRPSTRLALAAERHARDMVRHGYFAHVSRSGASAADRARRAGYLRGARAWTVGEVLAWGERQLSTPRATVRAWMNSPGHREVLLLPAFRHVGVGLARGLPVKGDAAGGTFVGAFGVRR